MITYLSSLLKPKDKIRNEFNRAFYQFIGGGYTGYDPKGHTYLFEGLLKNPVVYSVVSQKAKKANQVPYSIRKVKDKKALRAVWDLKKAANYTVSPHQQLALKQAEHQAYEQATLAFPMEQPNPLQTWGDIIGLYETYMSITGNFYLYLVKGALLEEPLQVYVLPSHLVEIVLKPGAAMLGLENPIAGYMLISGNKQITFSADQVIHIKTPNPNYDYRGSHLYGLSPLRAALRNIQSSNIGIDNNIKTLNNSGVFGFLHGTKTPLTKQQADSVKDKLVSMRKDSGELARIAGSSVELGFTSLSLSTDELKPFDFLDFDQKQLCNALGWDDKLLNNDSGAKYDNIKQARQAVIINTLMPSLNLLSGALTKGFLPLFKGYEHTVMEFDPSQLPEMQQEMSTLVDWVTLLVKNGIISRDEARAHLKLAQLQTPDMQAYTVEQDVLTLKEAINNSFIVPE